MKKISMMLFGAMIALSAIAQTNQNGENYVKGEWRVDSTLTTRSDGSFKSKQVIKYTEAGLISEILGEEANGDDTYKTKTTYTYNPEDTAESEGGTVTFKKSKTVSYTVPLLLPGSYVFLEKSALVVPEGCMALAMQLADAPSTNTAYQWSDYDRFVNSPLLYVMIFAKQAPNE